MAPRDRLRNELSLRRTRSVSHREQREAGSALREDGRRQEGPPDVAFRRLVPSLSLGAGATTGSAGPARSPPRRRRSRRR